MAQVQVINRPPAFEAGPDLAGKLCSICQSVVIAGEQILVCPYCALPFHAECWDENKGCSAYGCEGAPKTVKEDAVVHETSNAWGGEKPCPNCGKTIKGSALKCRFCGVTFDTRDVIGRKEYESREYEGPEYSAARNKSILLFLLSAAACIAPVGLILDLMLIYGGGIFGMKYKRLPASLRALAICSAGIAVTLIVVMLLLLAFDG